MELFKLGALSSVPASLRPDLLAEPTHHTLARAGLLQKVGVVEIDPSLSGVRRSKILVPGSLLGRLPHIEIIDGLAA